MLKEELYHRLFSDLRTIKLPVDEVDIFIRPYSSTFYGRYYPLELVGEKHKPKIYLYPFEKNGDLMSYDIIIDTAIHELCHHIQYSNGHIRLKGVMHDYHFWKLYNHYMNRFKEINQYEIVSQYA